MKTSSFKILDAIPIEHIYRYLHEKNASKEQKGGEDVGVSAARRKAKKDALGVLARKIALR
ncbi:hypothetical protein [Chryseobacterium sp.]|uniref:hypothetical protein n=1 Tax=Chryseobacterium sp. TaxID=1871047 RepID=UPI0011CB4996|nr:hypothetical protein [Chryseobacterium sp.]TXF75917.1 hypothetical protein FUA25_08410 [Chryseobacterium sp.]